MPDLTGRDIGRYHIVERLGEGGMATVYKAYDNRLERFVAIKMIRTDMFGPSVLEEVLKRFEREAKILAGLAHLHIVKIHDYGDFEGMPYLIMEFLPGGTLKSWTGKPISYIEAARMLTPVARALEYAHHKEELHRDIKPGNILFDQNGQPMLTDFGIAKILDNPETGSLTGTGVGIGTPEYMAPEQGMGKKVDARSDIYALGIVLYELITGRRPFSADTPMAVVLKQITEPLPRARQFVPDLPEEVEAVLFKALAKEPEQRYVDMGAFASALEQIANHKIPVVKKSHAQDESTVAQFPQQSVSETIQVKKKRLPVWIGVAALLAIAFVMIAGLAIFRYLSGSFPVITDTASNPAAALGEATGTPEPDFTNAPNELLTQTAGTLETKGIQPSLTLTHLPAATLTASPEPEPKILNFSACVEEPCSEKNNNYSFPEATKIIYLHWDFENMPLGANYVRSWKMENAEWVQYECTWPGPQDSKVDISLREPAGLASGTWSVTITVDGIELLNEQIKIEGNWDYWSPAGTISSCY